MDPSRGRARLLVALLAVTVGSGCSRGEVRIPVDAPIDRADCGWPAATVLAFAGWARIDRLHVPGDFGQAASDTVFALVSAQAVEMAAPAGPATMSRAACILGVDRNVRVSPIPDGWTSPGG